MIAPTDSDKGGPTEPDGGSAAPGVPARAAAATVLEKVLSDGLFLDAAEAAAAHLLDRLAPRDRAFCRRLVLSTIRRLGDIDAALAKRLNHPPEEPRILACLRIAAAELIILNAPPHAAVDAAVRVAKSVSPRFSGLVNAVARRLAADAEASEANSEEISPADWAARNTSRVFWRRLEADYGRRRAAAIIRAQAEGAALDLTPKDRAKAAALAERLGGAVTPTGSVRLGPSGAVDALDGYEAGEWWVQDAAAALPARLIGAQQGLFIGDYCAAPGGKTMQLAAAGADVVALDASEERLARLRENLDRTALRAEIVAADARRWRPDRPFDAILLDAPCTASGTARRHPEAPYVKDLDDTRRLIALQDQLLDSAWRLIRPGGRLVYCVCSLFEVEGPERAARFLDDHRDAAIEPVTAESLAFRREDIAACSELVTPTGAVRTSPAHWRGAAADGLGGLDGFFIIRFRKKSRPA